MQFSLNIEDFDKLKEIKSWLLVFDKQRYYKIRIL